MLWNRTLLIERENEGKDKGGQSLVKRTSQRHAYFVNETLRGMLDVDQI